MITYDNSIFNIIKWFNLGAIVVKFTMCNLENGENSSIDVVLNIGFGHDITILKMATFYKVDYIEIEPALTLTH